MHPIHGAFTTHNLQLIKSLMAGIDVTKLREVISCRAINHRVLESHHHEPYRIVGDSQKFLAEHPHFLEESTPLPLTLTPDIPQPEPPPVKEDESRRSDTVSTSANAREDGLSSPILKRRSKRLELNKSRRSPSLDEKEGSIEGRGRRSSSKRGERKTEEASQVDGGGKVECQIEEGIGTQGKETRADAKEATENSGTIGSQEQEAIGSPGKEKVDDRKAETVPVEQEKGRRKIREEPEREAGQCKKARISVEEPSK